MQKIKSKKVTQYILEVICSCKRKTNFLIATGQRISKKKLQLEIPSQEWNGWTVTKGAEQCPICKLKNQKNKSCV